MIVRVVAEADHRLGRAVRARRARAARGRVVLLDAASGRSRLAAARMPPGTAASISASSESKPSAVEHRSTRGVVGPMCRSTNGSARRAGTGWGGRSREAPRIVACGQVASPSVGLARRRSRVACPARSWRLRGSGEELPLRRSGSTGARLSRAVSAARRRSPARRSTKPPPRRDAARCETGCGAGGQPVMRARAAGGELVAGAGRLGLLGGALAGQLGERCPRSRARRRRWRCRRRPGRPGAGR